MKTKFIDPGRLGLHEIERYLQNEKTNTGLAILLNGDNNSKMLDRPPDSLSQKENHISIPVKPVSFLKPNKNNQDNAERVTTSKLIKPISFVVTPVAQSTDVNVEKIQPVSFYTQITKDKTDDLETDRKVPDSGVTSGSKETQNLPISNIVKTKKDNEEKKGAVCEKSSENTAYNVCKALLSSLHFILFREGLYYFTGTVYALLTMQTAQRLIVRYCRDYIEKAGTPQFVRNIYDFITIEPDIEKQKIDLLSRYVAFRNGVLDIQTNMFQPPNPSLFLTSYIDCEYTVSGSLNSPNFDNFLKTIANNDPILVNRIWEAIGYLLSDDNKGKKFFVFQGVRDSGKSTLGNFLASFFNEEARTSLPINDLNERFGLVELIGKKINTSLDLPDESLKSIAVSKIKQLTGGDILTAEPKYLPRVKFENTCKLLYATNFPIKLMSYDDAFFSRIVVIPFFVKIPQSNWNTNLLSLFANEKLAIIKKAFNNYRELVKNKYVFAGDYKCNEMFEKQNFNSPNILSQTELVSKFIENCCDFCSQEEGTFTRTLYEAYCKFYENDEYCDLLEIAQFSKKLQEVYGEFISKSKWRDKAISDKPENGYKGISLKN